MNLFQGSPYEWYFGHRSQYLTVQVLGFRIQVVDIVWIRVQDLGFRV